MKVNNAFIVAVLMNCLMVDAVNQCCQGENEIVSPVKLCPDGKPLKIECQKYILSLNDSYLTVDEHDNLLIDYEELLPPEQYETFIVFVN